MFCCLPPQHPFFLFLSVLLFSFFVLCLPLFVILQLIAYLSSVKNARQHLCRAKQKKSEQCTEINDSSVDKKFHEDRTLTCCWPNESCSTYRTLVHLYLLIQPEVVYDCGGTPLRYRHRSTTVLRGTTHPLPPSPPSSPYLRARLHLQPWYLLIPTRPLLHIRQFSTHSHLLHPPNRYQYRQRQRCLPRHDTGGSPLVIQRIPEVLDPH